MKYSITRIPDWYPGTRGRPSCVRSSSWLTRCQKCFNAAVSHCSQRLMSAVRPSVRLSVSQSALGTRVFNGAPRGARLSVCVASIE